MPRRVEEWIGKTDDTQIPPRVKLRVKARSNDCCEACGVRVRYGGQVDHILALINGGENRETNLRFLCRTCHAGKTRSDVSEKAKTARKQAKLASFNRTRKPYYPPKPRVIRAHWESYENGKRLRWIPEQIVED